MSEETKGVSGANGATFTQAELELLKKLGIPPNINEVRAKVARDVNRTVSVGKLPEEYDLVRIHTCKTCGTVTRKLYRMRRSPGLGCLVAENTISVGEKAKTIESKVDCCQACRSVMLGWTKDELIDLILKGKEVHVIGGGTLVPQHDHGYTTDQIIDALNQDRIIQEGEEVVECQL